MSNNKQSMKLYTEVALKDFLTNKQSFITLDDFYNLEAIELPSDDEIDKNGYHDKERDDIFKEGAKFVLNKIQGGNK